MLKETPTAIRAVLLDFGGVIAEEGFQQGLRALAEAQQLDPDEVMNKGRESVHDSGYVTGKGTEADFWTLLRERTGLKGEDKVLSQAILDRFIVRQWMIEQVSRLRNAGLTVAILSDQTDWLDYLDQSLHFSPAFDRVFNSFHLGKSKRDPTLFDDAVKMLGTQPGETLFIDDDPGHVERARSRGLHAIHFTERDVFEAQLLSLMGKSTVTDQSEQST